MANVASRIRDAAAKNTELLATLHETDHAAPDLASHNQYISDLTSQIRAADARIHKLDSRRIQDLKEHEKYRDSVLRRFAFKVSGKSEKFEERAKDGEKHYFDVLQEEHREKELRKNLDEALAEGSKVQRSLEETSRRHQHAQAELDALYEGIFQGPSPGFPEEDQREREKDRALSAYQQARNNYETENQARRLLIDAQRMMQGALGEMEIALDYSRMDMFGGGTMTDMMERNALHQADIHVTRVRQNVMQAQRMSDSVQNLPPVEVASGNLMSDVFFDNIFTDHAFHQRIRASNSQVQAAAGVLNRQVQNLNQRVQMNEADLRHKEQQLKAARHELQKAREAAFDKILHGKAPAQAQNSPSGAGPASSVDATTDASADADGDAAPPPYQP